MHPRIDARKGVIRRQYDSQGITAQMDLAVVTGQKVSAGIACRHGLTRASPPACEGLEQWRSCARNRPGATWPQGRVGQIQASFIETGSQWPLRAHRAGNLVER